MTVVQAQRPTSACMTPPALIALAVGLWVAIIHHGGAQ
jgi:hypothetical protein